MDILDKRLNDKGKNWRHVLKSLKVLDYCLHEGSELVVTWARKNIYIIKTLREFQHIDEDGRDVGQNSTSLRAFFLDFTKLTSFSSSCIGQGTDSAHFGRGETARRATRSEVLEIKGYWYRRICPSRPRRSRTTTATPTGTTDRGG